MTWVERHCGDRMEGSQPGQTGAGEPEPSEVAAERMSPGMGGDYDWERRMKAGLQQPPPPPEQMGLEGEYDPEGLLKRVALALDGDDRTKGLDSLSMHQDGSTIIFTGSVPNQEHLEQVSAITQRVDGTKAVDTEAVRVMAT